MASLGRRIFRESQFLWTETFFFSLLPWLERVYYWAVVKMSESSSSNKEKADFSITQKRNRSISIFFRLTRFQFTPLIFLPALVGAGLAYYDNGHLLNIAYLGLTLLGVILLHLGANAIDDCYDFENDVDRIANSMFPPDFGGWKPIPRGLISLRSAKLVSYALISGSLAVASVLSILVGYWALVFATIGAFLAIIYTAPPFKLDYRGLGLGEASILFAFGPLPALGSFYVQTHQLSWTAFLLSLPLGLMTVTILIDHDAIFFEVYKEAGKLSLATVLGRRNALRISMIFSLTAYAGVILMVAFGTIPVWSLASPLISGLVLSRKSRTYSRPNEPPPFYVPFTQNGMIADWLFSLILFITLMI